jgi:hypothetical protein
MRVRALLIAAVLVGHIGCRPASPGAGGDASAGRLELTTASGPLLSDPVEAAWCARDSTLALISTGRDWVVAVAVRAGRWPLDSSSSFAVASTLSGVGVAAVAVRSVRDSIRPAFLGRSGLVRLSAGDSATGDVDLLVINASGDSLQLRGSITGVPVRGDACPPPPDSVVLR